MSREQEVWVYADINADPVYVGRLFTRARSNRESASFAYDPSWLYRDDAYAIDPALPLGDGVQHTHGNRPLFGAFTDCAPDRWGRTLMARAEVQRARQEGATPRKLQEVDYLLRVNDFARQGALRLARPENPGITFESAATDRPIPPLVELNRLLTAASHLEAKTDTAAELQALLDPGSSLGGARPKASVIDDDGGLSIAKFPSNQDDYNKVRWEAVALTLAENAGLAVPQWRVENVAGKDVLLMGRFDRQGKARIPYQSAMTMLEATDNEQRSYLEIADALSQWGATPDRDKAALWRRIAFNVLISNTDDHLRNHGFLHTTGIGSRNGQAAGWRLSPAFDMNPVPADQGQRVLRTAIDIENSEASLELALEQADYFGLTADQAVAIASEVGRATAQWQEVATRLGLTSPECRRMESAFEHSELEFALSRTANPHPNGELSPSNR